MNWPQDISAESIQRVYLLANTPAYLVKGLKRDPAVAALSQRLTVSELVELVRAALSEPDRNSDVVGKAYAALVALSFHNYAAWREPLQGLDLSQLVWGDYVRSELFRSARVTDTFEVVYQPTEQVPTLERTASTSEVRLEPAISASFD